MLQISVQKSIALVMLLASSLNVHSDSGATDTQLISVTVVATPQFEDSHSAQADAFVNHYAEFDASSRTISLVLEGVPHGHYSISAAHAVNDPEWMYAQPVGQFDQLGRTEFLVPLESRRGQTGEVNSQINAVSLTVDYIDEVAR